MRQSWGVTTVQCTGFGAGEDANQEGGLELASVQRSRQSLLRSMQGEVSPARSSMGCRWTREEALSPRSPATIGAVAAAARKRAGRLTA